MTPEKEADPPEYVMDELLMAARKTTQRYSVDDCIAMAEALGLLRGLEDSLRKSGPKRKRRARELAARLDKHLKKPPPPLLKEDWVMPVHKTKGGYKYGKTGKTYPDRKSAEKQAAAIRASQRRRVKVMG